MPRSVQRVISFMPAWRDRPCYGLQGLLVGTAAIVNWLVAVMGWHRLLHVGWVDSTSSWADGCSSQVQLLVPADLSCAILLLLQPAAFRLLRSTLLSLRPARRTSCATGMGHWWWWRRGGGGQAEYFYEPSQLLSIWLMPCPSCCTQVCLR